MKLFFKQLLLNTVDMNIELPYELAKNHKSYTIRHWKNSGLIIDEEDLESLYYMYIYATHCELCDKEFPNTKDRCMDHSHETGEFRNIVCTSCNLRKSDVKIPSHNTSGYRGICKETNEECKQGFNWIFHVTINGKRKKIKSSIDKEKLIEFATKWKIDNNYNT